MSKIEWPSDKEKFEAIGYLAKPGVIDCIEATVPEDRLEKFRKEYDGYYTSEFPYITKVGSKYGYQFRIYLNDTEGCPDFLASQLDEKYQNRINDTRFIAELVKEYGFCFTHFPQFSDIIHKTVLLKRPEQIPSFMKGYKVYSNFLHDLSKRLEADELPSPKLGELKTQNKSKGRKSHRSDEAKSTYTREELFRLGWIGEEYIYKLLAERNDVLLAQLGISESEKYSITWFNDGFSTSTIWEDKSVGHGFDILVTLEEKELYLEVKSSKRKNCLFTMTSNEMQKMKEFEENYYLIKVDYLEKILKNDSPEILVFDKVYQTFFKTEKMKEATFKVEGD